jgi:hypothetical protein
VPVTIVASPAQTLSGPSCHRFTLTGTDNVGNATAISTIVKVDTTAPGAPALTLSAATGNTYVLGTTVTINAQAGKSGGFTAAATSTDADSGMQKINFPALTGFTSGGGDDLVSPFSTIYAWTGAVGATGAQTVTATNNATGTATSPFTVVKDTTGPTVTNIVSKQLGGAAGNGKLEFGDTLTVTFSEELLASTVPGSSSGTETRPGTCNGATPVTLTLPAINTGAQATGGCGYLTAAGSATFFASTALVENGASTTITLTVASVGGAGTPALGSGALVFSPASTIQDRVGNAATGTYTAAVGFKLF